METRNEGIPNLGAAACLLPLRNNGEHLVLRASRENPFPSKETVFPFFKKKQPRDRLEVLEFLGNKIL
jgi:hypothetical protein